MSCFNVFIHVFTVDAVLNVESPTFISLYVFFYNDNKLPYLT